MLALLCLAQLGLPAYLGGGRDGQSVTLAEGCCATVLGLSWLLAAAVVRWGWRPRAQTLLLLGWGTDLTLRGFILAAPLFARPQSGTSQTQSAGSDVVGVRWVVLLALAVLQFVALVAVLAARLSPLCAPGRQHGQNGNQSWKRSSHSHSRDPAAKPLLSMAGNVAPPVLIRAYGSEQPQEQPGERERDHGVRPAFYTDEDSAAYSRVPTVQSFRAASAELRGRMTGNAVPSSGSAWPLSLSRHENLPIDHDWQNGASPPSPFPPSPPSPSSPSPSPPSSAFPAAQSTTPATNSNPAVLAQSPEEEATLAARLLLTWLWPLLNLGYRAKRLDAADLPPLAATDRAAGLGLAFHYELRQRAANGVVSVGQVLCALHALLSELFYASAALLFLSAAASVAIPILLHALLDHISRYSLHDSNSNDGAELGGSGSGACHHSANTITTRCLSVLTASNATGASPSSSPGPNPTLGYVLALALFVASVVQSVAEQQFWLLGVRCGLQARTALMFRTFDKAQRLSAAARERYPSGRLTNLLMVDAARISDTYLVPNLHWGSWCSLCLLGVGLSFIYRMVGLSALAGLGVVLVCWPLAALIVGRVKQASLVVQERRDARARLMHELLSLIRVVHAFCWQRWAADAVMVQRRAELAAQATKQYLNALLVFFITTGRTLAPTLTFLVYAYRGPAPLTAPLAFACLAWFNLLRRPLAALPYAATNGMDVAVSLRRLATLFAEPELSSDQGFTRLAYTIGGRESQSRIVMQAASCEWRRGQARPTLRNLTLRVADGELILVVGPVGAGKSSLLAAMLGEMAICSGSVTLHGTTAIVTQQPWTQHATIRENILFGHVFEPVYYAAVLAACSLESDIAALPDGDQTVLGDGGETISGGQRQRLCLARAVYSRRSIVLLDDVLSAVDAAVGRHLFEQCICGLLANHTRVLVTHQTQLLSRPEVSRIVVLAAGGCIAATGTYAELEVAGVLVALQDGTNGRASVNGTGSGSGKNGTATSPGNGNTNANGSSGATEHRVSSSIGRSPSDAPVRAVWD